VSVRKLLVPESLKRIALAPVEAMEMLCTGVD